MIKFWVKSFCALALVTMVAGLSGCAAPANQDAMSALDLTLAKRHSRSVTVQTRGGNETGAMDSTNISNEEFRAAVEQSIVKNNLFKSVIQGNNGDYELTVIISQLSKPIFGLTFTVDMEAGWVLTKTSDKSVVMKKIDQVVTYRDRW